MDPIKRNICFLFSLISVGGAGCRKPYNPPAIASPGSYLVVEGTINSGADSTLIRLSQTVPVSALSTVNPVLNAQVSVQSDQNVSYTLTEKGNGEYAVAGLNLDNSRKYCLIIKTADGVVYQSDFEPVINTPPIDSVSYTVNSDGVKIYVDTHDASNNVKYYRWDYGETWQFHAEYESFFVSNGTAVVPRTAAQDVFVCFGNDTSSTIVLGSSAKLSKDVIYQNPVTQIAPTSEKIEIKYSILVSQHGITADAYNFWVNLKKNTEQLGDIFDPQPSNINGNVHCITNPAQTVVGYVSVGTVQRKRIFISNSQLPQSWFPAYPYTCEQDTAWFCHPRIVPCQNDVALFLVPPNSGEVPTSAFGTLGYFSTTRECADCTVRGTKKQPAFWK